MGLASFRCRPRGARGGRPGVANSIARHMGVDHRPMVMWSQVAVMVFCRRVEMEAGQPEEEEKKAECENDRSCPLHERTIMNALGNVNHYPSLAVMPQ